VAYFFAEPEQAVAIMAMIAISVVLGFVNEYRAEKTVEDLRQRVSLKAVVTRDGKSYDIDSKLLVPGDVVSLYIGDVVPADMRIVESREIQANEVVLTGESFPVEKTSAGLDLEKPIPQQLTNYLFMGTVIAHGSGRGLVISTGKNTEFGTISKSLARNTRLRTGRVIALSCIARWTRFPSTISGE
jgi:Mg2+-importing ATPase